MEEKRCKGCCIASALFAVLLIPAELPASTVTLVTHLTGASSPTGSDNDSVLQQPGTSAGYSAAADLASASTSVSVGFGWARVGAVASAGGVDAKGTASGQGMWIDELTFLAPGVSGRGVATVMFDVSGNLGASSGGTEPGTVASADWNLFFKSGDITQSFVGQGSINAAPGETTSTGDLHGGTYFVDFDFFFNIPIEIMVALNASADATHSGNAGALFENTLEWGGITELQDSTGGLVADFSIVSGSNVDWEQAVSAPAAVPLPAAIWMLAAGLLAFIPACREKSGQRTA